MTEDKFKQLNLHLLKGKCLSVSVFCLVASFKDIIVGW